MRELEVTKIVRETPDAVSIQLSPTDGEEIQYISGQFLTLVFDTPFGKKRRSYSISSAPNLNEPFSITVKQVENGEFSRTLVNYTSEGSKLTMADVGGSFVLPANPDVQSYLFLAAGSGITPIFSLIKTLLHTTSVSILLCYSNTSQEQTIFYNQLEVLKSQFSDRFQIKYFFSDNKRILERRLSTQRLTEVLEKHYTGLQNAVRVYVCGPFLYMDSAGIILKSFGVPGNHIKMEDFNPIPYEKIPRPPDLEARMVHIRMNDQTHTIKVKYPYSISKVAQEAGLPVPYSCESGQCASCVCKLISGEIWMAYNEVLTDQDLEKGLRLTCMGYPIHGDVTIEF